MNLIRFLLLESIMILGFVRLANAPIALAGEQTSAAIGAGGNSTSRFVQAN